MDLAKEYRTIDGSNNNLVNLKWGQAGTPLRRIVSPAYEDGISAPSGSNRPNPRDISNIVLNQVKKTYNSKAASDHFWIWGQFIDHDLDLTPTRSSERFDIAVP
jgi:hypothetical protein